MPGYLCWGHPEDWATDPVLSRAYCEGRIAQIRANEVGRYPAPNKHRAGTPEHYAFQKGLESWEPDGIDQPPDCCAELPRLGRRCYRLIDMLVCYQLVDAFGCYQWNDLEIPN